MPFKKGHSYGNRFKKGDAPWNKGLTKETDTRIHTGGSGIGLKNYWKNVTEEQKKIRADKISRSLIGRKLSEQHRLKNIETLKNRKVPSGENHYRWNLNREEVRYDRRNDPEYKQWRKKVYSRDGFRCRINDKNCKGRLLEAHHILCWNDFPELRYEVNNGITLCHAHHPRTRAKEKRLVPMFRELVSVSS